MKILVVDDEMLVRVTLREILSLEGHVVLEATDGRDALAKFEDFCPDIVMTDMLMPVMEGLETIKRIKALRPAQLIVAMSGGGRIHNMDFLKAANKFGADATIAKPFDPDQVLKVLNDLSALRSGPPGT